MCEVCQKTLKRKDYLKQHMKTHAADRAVWRCPREGCGRTYTTVFNLQSHILSFHEERRPFVCEHAGCGKTFAMKVSTAHLRGVWPPSWPLDASMDAREVAQGLPVGRLAEQGPKTSRSCFSHVGLNPSPQNSWI